MHNGLLLTKADDSLRVQLDAAASHDSSTPHATRCGQPSLQASSAVHHSGRSAIESTITCSPGMARRPGDAAGQSGGVPHASTDATPDSSPEGPVVSECSTSTHNRGLRVGQTSGGAIGSASGIGPLEAGVGGDEFAAGEAGGVCGGCGTAERDAPRGERGNGGGDASSVGGRGGRSDKAGGGSAVIGSGRVVANAHSPTSKAAGREAIVGPGWEGARELPQVQHGCQAVAQQSTTTPSFRSHASSAHLDSALPRVKGASPRPNGTTERRRAELRASRVAGRHNDKESAGNARACRREQRRLDEAMAPSLGRPQRQGGSASHSATSFEKPAALELEPLEKPDFATLPPTPDNWAELCDAREDAVEALLAHARDREWAKSAPGRAELARLLATWRRSGLALVQAVAAWQQAIETSLLEREAYHADVLARAELHREYELDRRRGRAAVAAAQATLADYTAKCDKEGGGGGRGGVSKLRASMPPLFSSTALRVACQPISAGSRPERWNAGVDYLLKMVTDVWRVPLPSFTDPFALRWLEHTQCAADEAHRGAGMAEGAATTELGAFAEAERTLKKYTPPDLPTHPLPTPYRRRRRRAARRLSEPPPQSGICDPPARVAAAGRQVIAPECEHRTLRAGGCDCEGCSLTIDGRAAVQSGSLPVARPGVSAVLRWRIGLLAAQARGEQVAEDVGAVRLVQPRAARSTRAQAWFEASARALRGNVRVRWMLPVLTWHGRSLRRVGIPTRRKAGVAKELITGPFLKGLCRRFRFVPSTRHVRSRPELAERLVGSNTPQNKFGLLL